MEAMTQVIGKELTVGMVISLRSHFLSDLTPDNFPFLDND